MTRILILDDDAETLGLIRMMLEYAGYEVLGTTSSHEALSILRAQPVDLFTQDFMRPDVDGAEFLRRMRSEEGLRDVPVLGLSAGARDLRAKQLRQVGLDIDRDLDGYLQKPFGPRSLLDLVEAVLRRHNRPLPPEEMRARARGRWGGETRAGDG